MRRRGCYINWVFPTPGARGIIFLGAVRHVIWDYTRMWIEMDWPKGPDPPKAGFPRHFLFARELSLITKRLFRKIIALDQWRDSIPYPPVSNCPIVIIDAYIEIRYTQVSKDKTCERRMNFVT